MRQLRVQHPLHKMAVSTEGTLRSCKKSIPKRVSGGVVPSRDPPLEHGAVGCIHSPALRGDSAAPPANTQPEHRSPPSTAPGSDCRMPLNLSHREA